LALVDAVSEQENLTLSASAFENENGEWMFEATCETPPDADVFSRVARLTLNGNVEFRVEKIEPDIDWIGKSLEGLPPVNAGGFYIHAGHSAGRMPPKAIPIHIEAGQAFGTGHHESTTGCLEAIYALVKNKKPATMIDVGTGSGVLAIALAKRVNRPVVASDIDPIAVETVWENAALNNVASLICAVEANGLDHAAIAARAPYDLIVANILAAALVEMAPEMARSARKEAAIILSGILTTQAAEVIAACARHNMVLNQRFIVGQWTTLLLEKI